MIGEKNMWWNECKRFEEYPGEDVRTVEVDKKGREKIEKELKEYIVEIYSRKWSVKGDYGERNEITFKKARKATKTEVLNLIKEYDTRWEYIVIDEKYLVVAGFIWIDKGLGIFDSRCEIYKI